MQRSAPPLCKALLRNYLYFVLQYAAKNGIIVDSITLFTEVKAVSDTIAAIATSATPAGIGVIRISGEAAAAVADKIFKAKSGVRLADLDGYKAAFGNIYDGDELLDEAVALRFVAPHSYTGENIVELSCHGGSYLLRRVLRAVIAAGARMAEAGEFTRRAFLNGKLDLTAAESVIDLIGASGEQAHRAALSAKNGGVFAAADSIKSALITAESSLAAWADFPDEEVPEVDEDELKQDLLAAAEGMKRLISTADSGRILREGVHTVIAGKPNVGKSTVMNMLLRCDRSIVTDIAGTTRDVVEESVDVGGIRLRLADTAGLRESADPVEAVGIDIARSRLEQAELIIAVFDGSRPLEKDDFDLIDALSGRKFVAVINKSDLAQEFAAASLPLDGAITVSAKNDAPDALERAISAALGTDNFDASAGILATERQVACVQRALAAVNDAVDAIACGMTLDAVSVCIDDALAALCELTGERASDAVIDEVFSRFCVGK